RSTRHLALKNAQGAPMMAGDPLLLFLEVARDVDRSRRVLVAKGIKKRLIKRLRLIVRALNRIERLAQRLEAYGITHLKRDELGAVEIFKSPIERCRPHFSRSVEPSARRDVVPLRKNALE